MNFPEWKFGDVRIIASTGRAPHSSRFSSDVSTFSTSLSSIVSFSVFPQTLFFCSAFSLSLTFRICTRQRCLYAMETQKTAELRMLGNYIKSNALGLSSMCFSAFRSRTIYLLPLRRSQTAAHMKTRKAFLPPHNNKTFHTFFIFISLFNKFSLLFRLFLLVESRFFLS